MEWRHQYLVTHTAVKYHEGAVEGSDHSQCYFWPENACLTWKIAVGFFI